MLQTYSGTCADCKIGDDEIMLRTIYINKIAFKKSIEPNHNHNQNKITKNGKGQT